MGASPQAGPAACHWAMRHSTSRLAMTAKMMREISRVLVVMLVLQYFVTIRGQSFPLTCRRLEVPPQTPSPDRQRRATVGTAQRRPGAGRPLTLVSAAAGSGKAACVGAWVYAAGLQRTDQRQARALKGRLSSGDFNAGSGPAPSVGRSACRARITFWSWEAWRHSAQVHRRRLG